jgi:hypothetical protein
MRAHAASLRNDEINILILGQGANSWKFQHVHFIQKCRSLQHRISDASPLGY